MDETSNIAVWRNETAATVKKVWVVFCFFICNKGGTKYRHFVPRFHKKRVVAYLQWGWGLLWNKMHTPCSSLLAVFTKKVPSVELLGYIGVG